MKAIIITGGSSGIGKACVSKFLSNNYYVYNLDIQKAPEFSLVSYYTWLNVNLQDPLQIRQAITWISHQKITIDGLIAAAGKHITANIEETSDAQLLELIQINILGTFWVIQATIPLMLLNGKGSIITIGSDQSTIAKAESAVYGLTKAAVAQLTKSTAIDYARYQIRANCIGAGTIDTPLYRKAITNYANTKHIPYHRVEQEEANAQPLQRIGTPQEVAELAYFLAQDQASFITGALIPIDGGYTAK